MCVSSGNPYGFQSRTTGDAANYIHEVAVEGEKRGREALVMERLLFVNVQREGKAIKEGWRTRKRWRRKGCGVKRLTTRRSIARGGEGCEGWGELCEEWGDG